MHIGTERPRLVASLINREKKSARHLLILFINGSRETQLFQIYDGVETLVLNGTEYETTQRAEALVHSWTTEEGYVRPRDGYAFEPLGRTIALAERMGFTIIFDARFKKTNWPNPNFTGAVELSSWPGMSPNNGGGYEYALDQMRLYAQPTLPPTSAPLVAPTDGKEFAAFLLKHKAVLDTVGPFREFVLGGD